MKQVLKVILITSILMIAGMGALLWKLGDIAKEKEKKELAKIEEEKDLLKSGGKKALNDIEKVDIVPLYMVGDEKNVVTFSYADESQIYNPAMSSETEKTITNIKKNKKFTFDEPFWAYNPYGTNNNAMYLYFHSSGNAYLKYTISVEDPEIPDFTRTLLSDSKGNLTKEHEHQLTGLIPGMKNFIILELYNKSDELSAKMTYSIDIPAESRGAATRLPVEKGYSKSKVSNGLYTVFAETPSKQYSILQYDNTGILRTEMPLMGYAGRNMQMIYDNLVYACSDSAVAKVNKLGQVMGVYVINGYRLSGEYVYDGSAAIYAIATEKKKKASISSKVLRLEMETGEVSVALDMDTLLKKVYKDSKKKKNWILLNSIQVTGTNELLLNSASLNSIFKVKQVSSLLPKIKFIIADPSIWNKYGKYQKKILAKDTGEGEEGEDSEKKKSKDFGYPYGQETVRYTQKGDGICQLEMLVNSGGDTSSYYCLRVDENEKTYKLKDSLTLDKNSGYGNVDVGDEVTLYCAGGNRTFQENGKDEKLIFKYSYPATIYRVQKDDWKGFWFY